MKLNILTKIILIAALSFVSVEASAAKVYGVFRVVKGKVFILKKSGKLKKARLGQKIYPLESVVTKKDSRAKVIMIDDNEINVSPNSKVKIAKYEFTNSKKPKNVLLNVLYGKVRSKVIQKYDKKDSKFQVRTQNAVAGVRGTDFFTSYSRETQKTEVVTFTGEVSFGLPGANGTIVNSVSVGVGQTTSSVAGAVPATAKSIPKSVLAQLDLGSDSSRDDNSSGDARSPANSDGDSAEGEDKEDKKGKKNKKRKKGKKDKKDKKAKKDKKDKSDGEGSETDQAGTDPAGTDPANTDQSGTDQSGTDTAATDPSGSEPTGIDREPDSIGDSTQCGEMCMAIDIPTEPDTLPPEPLPELLMPPPPALILDPVFVCTTCQEIIQGTSALIRISITPPGP